jgi:hypothetical protein
MADSEKEAFTEANQVLVLPNVRVGTPITHKDVSDRRYAC